MINLYPSVFTGADTTPQYSPGQLAQDSVYGYIYKYVLIHASSTAASAGRLFYNTATWNTVSDDYTGGAGLPEQPAGVAVGVIAASSYGWIMVEGYYSDVLKKTGAITIGDFLQGCSTDGKVVTRTGLTYTAAIAAGTIGIAGETVTAAITTVSALIRCN